VVVGLVRRRRTLSQRLTFFDVEPAPAPSPGRSAAAPPPPNAVASAAPLIQLVCEWKVPPTVVAGLRIQAAGGWETRQRAVARVGEGETKPTQSVGGEARGEERTGRFSVAVDGVRVTEDCRGESAWHNAAEGAAWRAMRRGQRSGDGDGGAPGGDAPRGSIVVGETETETFAASSSQVGMCLSWADFGRCGDPSCSSRHAAVGAVQVESSRPIARKRPVSTVEPT
jgi:hypothetical protein